MSGIIWLASYPKSGNTWFRTFISNLLNEKDEKISINQLQTDGIFSSRRILDRITGVETANLNVDEIDRLRPTAYNHLGQQAKKNLFIKVHDAYTYLDDETPLLGTTNAKAIYIMRNPLDVAVSFANHLSKDVASVIDIMGDETFALCNSKKRGSNQLRQKLLTWSSHVESWSQARGIPVHIIKYEDMKVEPLKTFTAAVQFIGLNYTEEGIQKAILSSDFNKLKAEEGEKGFKERPYKTASFFREGKVGSWQKYLSDGQRDQLLKDHESVMKKVGYLDHQGKWMY